MNMLQLLFELSELIPEGLKRIADEEPHRVRPGLLALVHHTSRMILHGLDVVQITHDILHQPMDDSNDRYKDEFNRQNLGDPTNDRTEPRPPPSNQPVNPSPHTPTKSSTPAQPNASAQDPPDEASEETQDPDVPDVPESASLPDPHDLKRTKRDLDAHTSNSDSDWGSDTDYTANAIPR